jgi:hypothetical protein
MMEMCASVALSGEFFVNDCSLWPSQALRIFGEIRLDDHQALVGDAGVDDLKLLLLDVVLADLIANFVDEAFARRQAALDPLAAPRFVGDLYD